MSDTHSGNGSRPFSAFKIATVVFVGARILLVPSGPAFVGAALTGIAVGYLPPPVRDRLHSTYGLAKQLVRERVTTVSRKLRRLMRTAGATIHVWMSKGTLVVAIWIAFTGELAEQFVETLRLSAEVWQQPAADCGAGIPAWAAAAS